MSEKVEDRLEELLLQYTYYYGMRRSVSDKRKCYGYIDRKYGQEMGYTVTYGKLSVGVTRIGYCVVGDLKQAEQILVAPFNTQGRTSLPGYRFYPLDEKRTQVISAAANIIDAIAGWVLAAVIFGLVYLFVHHLWVSALCAVAAFIVYILTRNNIFNFSASAPLALMHYIAIHCKKKNKFAFVFLDKSADTYLPVRLFLIRHKQELIHAKRIWFLNNLARGETLLLVTERKDSTTAAVKEQCDARCVSTDLPYCFQVTPKLTFLTAVDQDRKGRYCVKNLRCGKDKKMDVKRLHKLAQALLDL